MGGTTDDIRAALAEPFDPKVIGWKPQSAKGNRALAVAYIDARDVMDRLDAVVGVGAWSDEYTPLPAGCVSCRLRVKVGGEWVTKEDVGGPSDQPDAGDKLKAAYSDALKRAAVKFGVGRYLYSLPAVWCDFDPQKKQFSATPQLPAWATPKGAKQPARQQPQDQMPADKPKSAKRPDAKTVRELWERVSGVPTPKDGAELLLWAKSLDASLGKLAADHNAGELVNAVASFLRVDGPDGFAGLVAKEVEAGWNNAKQYVKGCETPANAGAK
jgi:hypothetical protein